MNPESWGFIGTLVGAIVGASASILTTRINSKNAVRIQQDLEQNKRDERFREFQRNTLLRLQENLIETLQLATEAHIQDTKHFEETNTWVTATLGDELNDELTNSLRNLSMITERIENSELRTKLNDFRKLITESAFAFTREESLGKIIAGTENYNVLLKEVGEELRQNY